MNFDVFKNENMEKGFDAADWGTNGLAMLGALILLIVEWTSRSLFIARTGDMSLLFGMVFLISFVGAVALIIQLDGLFQIWGLFALLMLMTGNINFLQGGNMAFLIIGAVYARVKLRRWLYRKK